jgi:hypothetical protein
VGYVLIAVLFGCVLYARRFRREVHEPGKVAMHEFYDMQNLILEKMDDPAMFEYKWRELLPLCRYADRRYRELWGPLSHRNSCEALLRYAMGEEEEEDAPV